MSGIYADVVWVGSKARLEATPISEADKADGVNGFKAVNSMAELEALEYERTTAVIIAEGPGVDGSKSRCREWIRLSFISRYGLSNESIARALRDQALLLPRFRSLNEDISEVVSGSQVTGPTWDYSSFAGENALLVNYSVLVEYEAFPRS